METGWWWWEFRWTLSIVEVQVGSRLGSVEGTSQKAVQTLSLTSIRPFSIMESDERQRHLQGLAWTCKTEGNMTRISRRRISIFAKHSAPVTRLSEFSRPCPRHHVWTMDSELLDFDEVHSSPFCALLDSRLQEETKATNGHLLIFASRAARRPSPPHQSSFEPWTASNGVKSWGCDLHTR